MRECPYTGLMPFTEEQAPFFFGRDVDREIITANLMASRLTLLYGPSGVGKSSVLSAGVAYHLRQAARAAIAARRESEFAIVVFKSWREDPLASLEDAIAREVGAPRRGATFADRLSSWAEHFDGDLLIVLDQLEEYFLYHPNEAGDGTFAVEFPRAVNRLDLRVSFLISMREDSIAKLDFFKGRIPNLFDNYLRIDHLARDAARDAIVKPVDVYNQRGADEGGPITIEPELVDAVLDQVTAGRVTIAETGRGRLGARESDGSLTRIETPYLQLVMTRLWQEEAAAGSRTLRAATLRRLGGADRIVATHLDAALNALTDADRDAAAKIFQYLVTPSGTKIALGVDDLAGYAHMAPADLRPLMVKLSSGENRILSPVAPAPDQPAGEWYQIFHDVLAAAVLEWRSRYVKVEEQRQAEADAAEQRRKAEKEARSAARLRRLLALVGVLFLVAVAAAWIAWRQTAQAVAGRRAAEQSRLEALQSRAEAVSATHAAEANRLEVLAANARTAAAQQETESLRLRAQAAEAQLAGRTEQARALAQRATIATTRAATEQQNYARLTAQAVKERDASVQARQQSEDLKAQTAAARPADAAVAPPVPQRQEERAPDLAPAPTFVTPPPPAVVPQQTPNAPSSATAVRGDYKEIYKKAIDAKNRRRWDEAATLFRAALQQNSSDSGERINISGFGNIEPYAPAYYLGIALKNLNDCQGALEAWQRSEQGGAIQNTSLYKSLQQNRQECLARK